MSGQPKPYINKSPRPTSIESVLPGFSSYNFMGEDGDVDFIEAYFIQELKKWIEATRPGITFGTLYSKPSPEHLYIDYSFDSNERINLNGTWRCDVSNAKIILIIGGLDYEYVYSIPNFSVRIGNFGDHVLYNRLLSSITNHIYPYNRSNALHLADYRSGFDEAKIKKIWKNDGCRLYEGIYEDVASDNGGKDNKYKLAMKYIDDKPCLIYLDGANLFDDWKEGEFKAWLEPTATSNTYKAQWVMANKEISTAYISFDNSAMISLLSEHNEKTTFIKLYPTANDNITIAGAQPTEWTGTGFALKDNYIVTNYHVIDKAKSISILGINGNFTKGYSADVIATDKNIDLAILKVNGVTIPAANIPYSVKTTNAEVGEEVFVLGYPMTSTMGEEIKLTTGVVSARSGFQGDVSLYQTTAPIQPGNSGGPLFDSKGNVIGIVSAKHAGAENVGYAIKASYLRNLMESAVPNNILPQTNKISAQNLSGKVKAAKNFVYYIVCSNRVNNDNSFSQSRLNKEVETNASTNTVPSTNKAEEYYNNAQKYDKEGKYVESLEWYIKAANLGHIDAQSRLGLMYLSGEGVTQDYSKAFEWYQKAADQDDVLSQFFIGSFYHSGIGVKQDYNKAFEWYQKAAKQNNADAQYYLGSLYLSGTGVSKDIVMGVEWIKKSADQGQIKAQLTLGSLYFNGTGVSKDITKAFEWTKKAADQGSLEAQLRLGYSYYNGIGIDKDIDKAVEWLKKAADQGDTDALKSLGELFYEGKEVKQDIKSAELYLTQAAEKGDAVAMNLLGWYYFKGDGFLLNYDKAESWFRKSLEADPSWPYPYSNMALLYAKRDKNYTEAIRYSDLAIAKASDKKPEDQAILYGERGLIYYWKGDIENAKMMLNKCIELKPNYLEGNDDFAKVMKSYNK